MKYLLDKDGNLFKAVIVSAIPDGFTDISEGLIIDADTDGVDTQHLEAEAVAEVPEIEHVPEHWTNGTDTVYDANDIPVLTDENGDPSLDPDYDHVAAVEAAAAVPAHHRIKKTLAADQEIREIKMDLLRALRQPLLEEASIQVAILFDAGQDHSAWSIYRQELRDITQPYKKLDGDWKDSVDSLDVESFTFPTKP